MGIVFVVILRAIALVDAFFKVDGVIGFVKGGAVNINLTSAVTRLHEKIVVMVLFAPCVFVPQMVDAQGDAAVGDDIVMECSHSA